MTAAVLQGPPIPPNDDLDRALIVRTNGAAGNPDDPIMDDVQLTKLIELCGQRNVNLVYLDVASYIANGNWNPAQVARVITYLQVSGVKIYALLGGPDWAHQQQRTAKQVLQPVSTYGVLEDALTIYGLSGTGSPAVGMPVTNGGAALSGVLLDVAYWATQGYQAAEPIGLIDLMNATRRYLGVPVGVLAPYWLLDPAKALSISVNGVAKIEGQHLVDNADFVVVRNFANTGAQQIAQLQPWYDYASAPSVGRNVAIYNGTGCDEGVQGSYWTGNVGALATMETELAKVSAAFKPTPSVNMTFAGSCLENYSPAAPGAGYAQMT